MKENTAELKHINLTNKDTYSSNNNKNKKILSMIDEDNSSNPTTTSTKKNDKFDSTGMFHWTWAKPFEERELNANVTHSRFTDHIIVCVYAEATSPLIGLRNFVLPLRASNYHRDQLKQIIFIGNRTFLMKRMALI